MPSDKKQAQWLGRNILDEKHSPDLEYAAAIHEFGNAKPRKDAEEAAYNDYKREHHTQAAAHHLRGMRAAEGSHDFDEARKHSIAYSLHMNELGHDPMDAVPNDIKELAEGEKLKGQYRFKSHKGDLFLLGQHEEPKDQ